MSPSCHRRSWMEEPMDELRCASRITPHRLTSRSPGVMGRCAVTSLSPTRRDVTRGRVTAASLPTAFPPLLSARSRGTVKQLIFYPPHPPPRPPPRSAPGQDGGGAPATSWGGLKLVCVLCSPPPLKRSLLSPLLPAELLPQGQGEEEGGRRWPRCCRITGSQGKLLSTQQRKSRRSRPLQPGVELPLGRPGPGKGLLVLKQVPGQERSLHDQERLGLRRRRWEQLSSEGSSAQHGQAHPRCPPPSPLVILQEMLQQDFGDKRYTALLDLLEKKKPLEIKELGAKKALPKWRRRLSRRRYVAGGNPVSLVQSLLSWGQAARRSGLLGSLASPTLPHVWVSAHGSGPKRCPSIWDFCGYRREEAEGRILRWGMSCSCSGKPPSGASWPGPRLPRHGARPGEAAGERRAARAPWRAKPPRWRSSWTNDCFEEPASTRSLPGESKVPACLDVTQGGRGWQQGPREPFLSWPSPCGAGAGLELGWRWLPPWVCRARAAVGVCSDPWFVFNGNTLNTKSCVYWRQGTGYLSVLSWTHNLGPDWLI
ncbi:uncharacterized protein LOC141916078 [Strix aluco]|uniref:uncharacterized protein LOC141916078 n=1 Tax=Strix aluco TaxID=111821 RepID=UPI003DA518C3